MPTSSTWPRPKLSELIPSGGQTRFDNRIRWGRHYLRQAGPVKLQDKAYAILPAGHQLLASETGDISGQALKRLTRKPAAPDPLDGAPTTPEEIVDAADQEMQDSLDGQLLHSIRRNFIGSLDTQNASKGVFITTSDFTAAARQTAANTSKLILPVNGPELARLMVHHKVGVITQRTCEIEQTDENYFVPE